MDYFLHIYNHIFYGNNIMMLMVIPYRLDHVLKNKTLGLVKFWAS